MPTYTNEVQLRELLGNPDDQNKSASLLTLACNFGESWMNSLSGRSNWAESTGDVAYWTIVGFAYEFAELFADKGGASGALSSDEWSKLMTAWEKAKQELIKSGALATAIIIDSSDFETSPGNPEAPEIYRIKNPGGAMATAQDVLVS